MPRRLGSLATPWFGPVGAKHDRCVGLLGERRAPRDLGVRSCVDAAEAQPIDYGRRTLSFAGLAVVVVAYLATIKGIGTLTTERADLVDDVLATPSNVVWALGVPLGAAFVFVYALITYLGWWPAVLHDSKPVQRWVWSVPIIFLVAIAFGINYGGLAARGLGFTLLLLVATQFVGWGEQGMFRCLSVTTMRRHEWAEGRVALWSSGMLRIEVSDQSRQTLQPRTPDIDGGWGLKVVSELATRWGVDRHRAGKMIWVELDLSDPST